MNQKRIKKLTGRQARIALLKLLEDTYEVGGGYIWDKRMDEAVKIAESYPPTQAELEEKSKWKN